MNVILNKLLEELKNIIESPFLIWEILTMLRFGIKGESARELDNFLQLIATDIDFSQPTIAIGSTEFSPGATKTKIMWIANRIFIKAGSSLNENFANALKQKFACGVEELDFSAPCQAAKTINEWVKLATNERIPKIISSNDLGSDTQAVLANAIYFKAQWKQQFEPADTKSKPFHIDAERSVPVPMMSQVMNARYAYLADHKAKVVELPYRDTDLAMLVVLPIEVATKLEVVANLRLSEIVDKLVFRKVSIELPKFTFGCTIKVHSLLEKFGVRGIFHASSDYSSLMKDDITNFQVSKIIQQAFIKVTEEGTEAAAATACCIDGAFGFEEKFIADRPFYFCIKNRKCLKLFEGCYRHPDD